MVPASLNSLLGQLPAELVPLAVDVFKAIANSRSPRDAALSAMMAAERVASNAAADAVLKKLHGE